MKILPKFDTEQWTPTMEIKMDKYVSVTQWHIVILEQNRTIELLLVGLYKLTKRIEQYNIMLVKRVGRQNIYEFIHRNAKIND